MQAATALNLNGTWKLAWAEGSPLVNSSHLSYADLGGWGFLDATVPAPVHQVLQDAGMLEDPNVGLNSLSARWVEEMYWSYRRTFKVPAAALKQHAWLVFDRLEFFTRVYLNGEQVGQHANAHRPARFDVTGKLRAGENIVVVMVSAGFHELAEKSAMEYNSSEIGLLAKRAWQRRPQHQMGWDWHPRLTNVGILGSVRVEWCAGPRLDLASVSATVGPDLRTATVRARACVENPTDQPVEAELSLTVADTGHEVRRTVALPPGESVHEVSCELTDPKLWWPVGQGDQHRYDVTVRLHAAGGEQSVERKLGIRRVEIDQSVHPVEGRYFILRINNRPIFCKGGNWVPPDLLYSTAGRDRYAELIDLAVAANFNLLRVWGGGEYASEDFADLCDQRGVMIWHDMGFACSKYPGDDPEFLAEVNREITHVVRRLAHHPSLVVWCGNNEIEWGDWEWRYSDGLRTHPHYVIFHRDIPRILKAEDSSRPYWPSSPYSPDFCTPSDPTCGDQHPWGVSIGNAGPADFWLYRQHIDRFANEGGVIGASTPATLRQFLPESDRRLLSPSWIHHDNPLACLDKDVSLGKCYQTVKFWTGRDPLKMDWEDYAFCSAMTQAEGLTEYVTNYRRRMFSSACAVFWMYNDSWPATHGWTIVDYYRRRKLAYHPVRRAMAPVTVVVTEQAGDVVVYGVNDSPSDWRGDVRYGLFKLAGGLPLDETAHAHLPANASTVLARFGSGAWRKLGLKKSGAFAVLSQAGRAVAQHRMFLERFGDLAFSQPQVRMRRSGGELTLTSDAFVWGVCLDLDGEKPLSDNCFDVLPGIPYTLPWPTKLGQPKILKIASRDALGR